MKIQSPPTLPDREESRLSFYDSRRSETYGDDFTLHDPKQRRGHQDLLDFIDEHALIEKRCLEIGSSGGSNQDLVEDYYGTDLAPSLGQHYHKPYRAIEGTRYPFDGGMFDAIWTDAVFEHIPGLQAAMLEVVRLLKPGGVLYFKPAWQCRSWAAEGYPVRPYSDFGLRGKLIKASIPLRDSVLWRSLALFPKRVWRHFGFLMGRRYPEILYRRIEANWEVFWMSDSDACNSIDPHDALLWFESHGLECLSHPLHQRALLVRTGALIFRKK